MEVLGFQSFLQSDDVHFFFVRAYGGGWLPELEFPTDCIVYLPYHFYFVLLKVPAEMLCYQRFLQPVTMSLFC